MLNCSWLCGWSEIWSLKEMDKVVNKIESIESISIKNWKDDID
jgi:hypothetical protein